MIYLDSKLVCIAECSKRKYNYLGWFSSSALTAQLYTPSLSYRISDFILKIYALYHTNFSCRFVFCYTSMDASMLQRLVALFLVRQPHYIFFRSFHWSQVKRSFYIFVSFRINRMMGGNNPPPPPPPHQRFELYIYITIHRFFIYINIKSNINFSIYSMLFNCPTVLCCVVLCCTAFVLHL